MTLLRQCLAVIPDDLEAHNLAAVCERRCGRPEAALHLLQRLIFLDGSFPDPHANAAMVLEQIGRSSGAAAAARRALSLAPRHEPALVNLGLALRNTNRPEAADAILRNGLRWQPGSLPLRQHLGDLRLHLGDGEGAAELFGAIVEDYPGLAPGWFGLAIAGLRMGQDRLEGWALRRALSIAPTSVVFWTALGNHHKTIGQMDEAERAYRLALMIEPSDAEALYGLVFIGRADPDTRKRIRRFLESETGGDRSVPLAFALARLEEKAGDSKAAFAALALGNCLKRQQLDYDVADDERLVDRIIDAFPQPLPMPVTSGHRRPTPILIFGMPRSGTSLLEQVLASHSRISGGGELLYLKQLADAPPLQVGVQEYPEYVTALNETALDRLGSAYRSRLADLSDGRDFVTDKLPANFLFVGLAAAALPDAKLIHCRRSAMDTCFSCYRTLFTEGQDFSYNLEELGRHYRAYDRLMGHWHRLLGSRIVTVDYSAMVDDFEGTVRSLLARLEIGFEQTCLDFHKTDRPVRTASATQVRQPIYRSALGAWRRYADELKPLLETLGPLADEP